MQFATFYYTKHRLLRLNRLLTSTIHWVAFAKIKNNAQNILTVEVVEDIIFLRSIFYFLIAVFSWLNTHWRSAMLLFQQWIRYFIFAMMLTKCWRKMGQCLTLRLFFFHLIISWFLDVKRNWKTLEKILMLDLNKGKL